jgi:hypothetical protein
MTINLLFMGAKNSLSGPYRAGLPYYCCWAIGEPNGLRNERGPGINISYRRKRLKCERVFTACPKECIDVDTDPGAIAMRRTFWRLVCQLLHQYDRSDLDVEVGISV